MIKRQTVAALSLSAAAFTGILVEEGYRGEAYIPVKGDVPTVGFGTTGGVKPGDTTDPIAALLRAHRDVTAFEGAIKRCVEVPLHQHEYDALVSFSYNVGSGAFCSSTLVKKLNQQDYDGACNELLRWRYVGGYDCSTPGNTRCSGLWDRRKREYQQCMGVS